MHHTPPLPLPSTEHAPPYRTDIDGIRAFAVLCVVVFHAFPQAVPSGFIGVDVFFVISGYLISGILLRGQAADNFSFRHFYMRRIRRIFPALILVLGSCFIGGWNMLFTSEYTDLGKHIAGGAGFISNWILWQEAGYFDTSAAMKPLLHLWSLGIEEQFYLLWPVVLWLGLRNKINPYLLIGALIVVSFGICIGYMHADTIMHFYAPQARFWELMLGAALAQWSLGARYAAMRAHIAQTRIRHILSILGASLLIIGAFVETDIATYPNYWALLPTLGTCALLAAGMGGFVNQRLLSTPLLVGIGLISYPLYLWHWPLLSFVQIIVGETPERWLRGVLIAVSLLLAWATYYFIEKPVRFKNTNPRMAPLLCLLLFSVGLCGYYAYVMVGIPSRLSPDLRPMAAIRDWDYPATSMHPVDGTFRLGGQGKQTLFYGDSNVQQYATRMADLVRPNSGDERGIIFLTLSGMPPIAGVLKEDNKHLQTDDELLNLARDPRIDRVVIAAAWIAYFSHNKPDYGLFTITNYRIGKLKLDEAAGKKLALERLAGLIDRLVAMNKKVYIVGQIPAGREFNKKFIYNDRPVFLTLSPVFSAKPTMPKADILTRIMPLQTELKNLATAHKAEFIDPIPFLCPRDTCPTDTHSDEGHLKATFTRLHVDYLDATVMP